MGNLARNCITIKRSLDTVNETSHAFTLPALLQAKGATCTDRLTAWQDCVDEKLRALKEAQAAIDDLSFDLYGIPPEERETLTATLREAPDSSDNEGPPEGDEDEEEEAPPQDAAARVQDLLSWCVGVVVGRFDVRLATGERPIPEPGDSFAPLPIYSPGMLEEVPQEYPVEIDSDGILVDDEAHSDDMVRRVRDVLTLLWKGAADAVEQEICGILGVKSLRHYFVQPGKGGFFEHHTKRYSGSRRKAPLYWLLQSSRKNYSLWLYYHKFDRDMLYKALENYVRPRVQREENRLAEMAAHKARAEPGGKEMRRLAREMEKQEALIHEIMDFREKLEKAAALNLEPDRDDGVVLNMAPHHELVPWKEPEKYWEELRKGRYEWSSMSRSLRKRGIMK
jgi:hypothetical protein